MFHPLNGGALYTLACLLVTVSLFTESIPFLPSSAFVGNVPEHALSCRLQSTEPFSVE